MMEENIEIKKVDPQGRIVLPLDWREYALKETNEVIIIKENEYLKIIPKKKGNMSEFFDSLEFGEDIIEKLEDWTEAKAALIKKNILRKNP